MSLVATRHDAKRGCGWRKPGGLYLVCDGPSRACGKLPIPLGICPTCSAGIKPTRGFTWVDADALLATTGCAATSDACATCVLGSGSMGRAGLLWIGEKFYPTPGDWTAEAIRQGVSRRLSTVPREFVVGKTWVLVAHRKAIPLDDGTCFQAAVFHAFKPTAIEYVVKGDESDEQLEALIKRGVTPVRIERTEGQIAFAQTELVH